jgi:hypothetical protein
MTEQQSIKDTLDVIRKALEDDTPLINNEKQNDDILILNKLVKNDGTINMINKSIFTKSDTINILNNKLDDILENCLNKWFDKNLPQYLEKYLQNKKK